MKNRSFAHRAERLMFLFFLSTSLSVALTTNSFASTSDSPGGNSNSQASLFMQSNPETVVPTDGGNSVLLAQSEEHDVESQGQVITLSNSTPAQGEPVKVTVSDTSVDTVTFDGQSIKLFSEEVDGKPVKTTLIAISPLMKPGRHKLVAGSHETMISVHDAHFGVQRLHLPKEKDNFNASPGEKETINKAKSIVSDEKRWQGTFQKPVRTGRLSTRFGVRRVVNGKLLADYFHSGLDFAAPAGTPVHAAAPGRVVVAHTGWKLHGNVVCIDHGRGVVSIGIHMTKVKVKVGDQVETGQVVGTVGMTGRASGPHLHYGIYVNNVASNPEYWFRNQY